QLALTGRGECLADFIYQMSFNLCPFLLERFFTLRLDSHYGGVCGYCLQRDKGVVAKAKNLQ
ncbi:MAG: hypothetical protein ACK4VP_00575, partial [Nitrospira sp.]